MGFPLPVFQNYDCHSCGFCCRNLVVNVTPAEREKILEAGWSQRIPDLPLFIEYRFGGRRLIRLAHRDDGACVFLGSDGKCRIHAETGLAAKPLACRLYPYVPTPGVGAVRCDVRGDCPSVAANKGRSLGVHRAEIVDLAREVDIGFLTDAPAWDGVRLNAGEFETIVTTFEDLLCARSLSLRSKLYAGAHLVDLLHSIRPEKVRGERFTELMGLLAAGAMEEASSAGSATPKALGSKTLRLFRQWLFLHAIADDPADLECGRIERFRRSWRRYGESRQFSREEGPVPPLRREWSGLTFEQVRQIGPAPDDALEPLIRSMRVKLQAHAFAGPAYFGYEFLAGLTCLWMLPSVVGWMARAHAAVHQRASLSGEDVLEGVRQAHHTFGVSPVFGRISERLRLRALAQPHVASGLLSVYSP